MISAGSAPQHAFLNISGLKIFDKEKSGMDQPVMRAPPCYAWNSERIVASITRTNPNRLLNIGNENLAVTDLAGTCC